jgi:uncharacterized protein with HEPN domain
MKKIKIMRQSKLPVTLKNLEDYKSDWKVSYDKLYDEHKKKYGMSQKDLPILGEKLEKLEKEMIEKYPVIEEWDWIKSKKKWNKLVTEYGPIAIATSSEDPKEIVYVIMDQI